MTSEPELLEESLNHQSLLTRQAAMYLPASLGSGGLFMMSLNSFMNGAAGAIIPMLFVGVVTGSFVFQGISALRDKRAQPISATGMVRRTWSRGGLLWFFRSHYVHVDKTVYTVQPTTALSLAPGDTIEVEHWPHTKTVIRVHRVRAGSGAGSRRRPWEPEQE